MKTRKKRILWLVIGGFLIFIGTPSFFIAQELRQDNLDHRLMQAMDHLDAATFERLLNDGASANARDTSEPPLTIPVLLRRLLARLQHKPDDTSRGERMLLQVLTLALAEQLYNNSGRNAPIYDTMAVSLIRHGAGIDLRGKYGQTALHTAVVSGLHRTVNLLLSRGAASDARGHTGMPPLMGADTEWDCP